MPMLNVRLVYPEGHDVLVSLSVIGDTFDDTAPTDPVIDLDLLETIGGE